MKRAILIAVFIGAVLGSALSEFGIHVAQARVPSVESAWAQTVEGQAVNTPLTQEYLFTTTSACVTSLSLRKGLELYNNGPNTLFCSLTAAAVLNKGRPITPQSSWAIDLPPSIPLCCITSALQVTGAGSIATQTR